MVHYVQLLHGNSGHISHKPKPAARVKPAAPAKPAAKGKTAARGKSAAYVEIAVRPQDHGTYQVTQRPPASKKASPMAGAMKGTRQYIAGAANATKVKVTGKQAVELAKRAGILTPKGKLTAFYR